MALSLLAKARQYFTSKSQDNEGWLRQGKFTPQQNLKTLGGDISQRWKQQGGVKQFTPSSFFNTTSQGASQNLIKPIFGQRTGEVFENTVKNRITDPIVNVPSNAKATVTNLGGVVTPFFNKNLTLGQKFGQSGANAINTGVSALKTAGGLSTFGPEDVVFAGWDMLKAKKAGRDPIKALEGTENTGLGDALGKTQIQKDVLNIAELPLSLMVMGSLNSKNADEVSELIAKRSKLTKLAEQTPDAKNVTKAIAGIDERLSKLNLKINKAGKVKIINPPPTQPLDTGVKQPTIKIRGFTESVQEAPKVTKGTKVKVTGEYTVKPTDELMGEAKALLTEGASIKDVNKVQNIDAKIAATIQQAINLDKSGKHREAAALFNNLSQTGTELGRGVHAFTLLNQMSPEAISLSAAGRIKKYNETAKVKIPELTADQQKMISDDVRRIQSITDERIKNIELNKLQEKISDFIPSSFADKLITTWKAGLLTSLRTAGRNIVGNTIMQGSEIVSSKPAALADWIMSQKTGQRTTVGSLQGTLSGGKIGVNSAVDVMKYGFDPNETITKFDIKRVTWKNNPVEQALKKYTDFVFNSLSAQDKPFWNASYARSLYDQAAAMALNQGRKGNKKFIQGLVDNATEQMKTIATNDANYATFKDKNMISNIAAGFKRAAGQKEWSKLPAEIVAPFTGVPSSIVGKTIDYSPLGLIKGIKDVGKVMTKDVPDLQRKAAQELGRGTIGTALFALGSYLMSKGLMTGQPKDDKERKQWELEGRQQNSILVNGKWRSINSVGPQTLILLAGAKFDEEMNDPEGSMAKYGLTLVQDQLGQTFLSGVQQPLQAITDPNRYGKSYVGNQVASFIPNIVKDTSKALDPLSRETDTGSFAGNIKTSVQSGIPIWRNQMTPRRDVLGNKIKQEPTGLGAYIDLFNSKTPISNNVVDELSRLNKAGYNATPSKLSSTQTIKGVKGKLTQQELDVLETKTGIAVTKGLDNLFKSSSYQKLDDEDKQKAIKDLVSKTRKQVRATIDLTVMPDLGYTTSADSPKGVGKVALYGTSLVTDPKQTIKAILDGNPIRKVDGGAVILERKNALGTLDAGDKTTQIDHIIPLSHGGTNDKENLQQLSNEEHKIKTEFNNYWLKEFKAGRISKKELQEKDKNWRKEVENLPVKIQEKLISEMSTDTSANESNTYQIVNEDTGSITTIDLSKPIEAPKLTGYAELDKKLKSSYKSAITTRINNITKLYKDGQISAEKANQLINELKVKSGSTSTKSKGGKITIAKTPEAKVIKIKLPTIKLPQNTLKSNIKVKKPSIAQLKKRRTIKIKV